MGQSGRPSAWCSRLPAIPGTPQTGGLITGLDDAAENGSQVIQAGTARRLRRAIDQLRWAGAGCGRHRGDLEVARARAYDSIGKISLPGSFYRTDIALAAAQLAIR